MKESKLELQCTTLASRLGWIAYKGFGRVGSPDKIYTKGRNVFFVEFKNPNRRGRVSEAQKREHKILRDNGSSVHVINNLEDFRNILVEEEEFWELQS